MTFLTGFPARRPQPLGDRDDISDDLQFYSYLKSQWKAMESQTTKILNKSKKYEMHL